MKDLALDLDPASPTYGDYLIKNHSFQIVDGIDYIIQKLYVALRFVYGEWFLDTTMGIKYFDSILVKNPNMATVESVMKSAIMGSYGVTEITAFEMDFDKNARTLTLSFTVNTIEGSASMEITVP